jgi:hypothetical protein
MSTLLEFNRDLFLCNSIHDPQNQSDIIPSYNSGKIYKRSNITDPSDNIFILPPKYLDTPKYKSGIYKNGDNIITTYNNTVLDVSYALGTGWQNALITYDNYINNLERYLNGNSDVWIGSGTITIEDIPPPTLAPTTTPTGSNSNNPVVSTTPSPSPTRSIKSIIDEKIVGVMPVYLNLINSISDYETRIYAPEMEPGLDEDFDDIKRQLGLLKTSIRDYNKNNVPPQPSPSSGSNSDIPPGPVIIQTHTYHFKVTGGSLVRVNQGLVGNCDKYKITSVCPINPDDAQEQQNCEICKNMDYRDWYDNTQKTHINRNARYEDSTTEYVYTWLQTWNLGIGIGIMVYGIYYQLS